MKLDDLRTRVNTILGQLEIYDDDSVLWTDIARAQVEILMEFDQFEREQKPLPKDTSRWKKFASEEPVGFVRPGADYLLENYGNTNIYAEEYAGPEATPLYRKSSRIAELERENERLTKWKENIVQLCVELGAKVQDWTGGDTSKGFAHYFIKSLHDRAVRAEAARIPPGWLNLFFALQQEERKKQEYPLRAH